MNTIGEALKITLFGESHGKLVGCTIDGLPCGFQPDEANIHFELMRRAPRNSAESTTRSETDEYEIVSGLYKGRLTGAPLTVLFPNMDADDKPYSALRGARPSHADMTANIKYNGFNDPRGGGMFSGRMTAPLVFAGALIKQLLSSFGVSIGSHIANIGPVYDKKFDYTMTELPKLDPLFPLIDPSLRPEMENALNEAKLNGTSLGGSAECAVIGVPSGIGEPFFDSVESVIAHLVFSVPGVHAVEFGAGFGLCALQGHEANDEILPGGKTSTNNSGGVNGGITNSMPIIFRAGFRPIPSIEMTQNTIDLATGERTEISVKGRHDVCILPRGLAVIEACAAIGIYELVKRAGK